MSCAIRQDGITIIELGPSYDSLDDRALEDFGGLLISEATHADPPRLVVDFSRTNYFGSAFIELMLQAWKRLKQRDGAMVLCSLQPRCQEILQVARMDCIWDWYPTRDEAVRALEQP